MKIINSFLRETKFVTPISVPSETEIRFVIDPKNLEGVDVDKTKSSDYTDMYLSSTRRYRIVYSNEKTNDYENKKIYEIKCDPGSKSKIVIEIDPKALDEDLTGKKILMKIIKRGVGQVNFPKLGISGYCEKVIAMTNKNIICDELQIEFEDLRENGEIDYLVELLNPEKVFQCGLIDYVLNKAKFLGYQT